MQRPELHGIHHLKLPVSDLARSQDFYARAFGANRIAAFDHFDAAGSLFAIIMEIAGLGTYLELRLSPERARAHSGFDPMTLSVRAKADLERWIEWLDAACVPHSPVLPAYVAWLIVVEDPDANRIRLYTDEKHGPEIAPSQDKRWL